MDDADIVTERVEREITAALLSFRHAQAARRAAAMAAGLQCMICGEEIPAARRKALPNCCTCFDCQVELEGRLGR